MQQPRLTFWATIVLVATAFSTTLRAQTINVPHDLVAGVETTITVDDPKRAGQTVTVFIDDGKYPDVDVREVMISLDADGHGVVEWIVPTGWLIAQFNSDGCKEVERIVSDSADEG